MAFRFINPGRDVLARRRRDPRQTRRRSQEATATRYIECSGCGFQVHDLYMLAKDHSARKGDSGRIPLACPKCKSSSVTFSAYEGGEGSFY